MHAPRCCASRLIRVRPRRRLYPMEYRISDMKSIWLDAYDSSWKYSCVNLIVIHLIAYCSQLSSPSKPYLAQLTKIFKIFVFVEIEAVGMATIESKSVLIALQISLLSCSHSRESTLYSSSTKRASKNTSTIALSCTVDTETN